MEIEYIPCKSIITKNKNCSWFGTEYNMNIYRGCLHGCIYCDSRSDCYRNFNFDRIKVKENAVELIEANLKSLKNTGVVALGAMSDPYNDLESRLNLTSRALGLFNSYGFGTAIATKSPTVVKDIDILKELSLNSPVIVKMTITTFDEKISKIIEPNVAAADQRFDAIYKLSKQDIYCGVLMMPILPFINDNVENITNIVKRAADCGAKFVYPFFGVTLRDAQRDFFYKKLDESFPNVKEKYISSYKNDYVCNSLNSKNLFDAFVNECQKHNITYKMKEIITQYKDKYKSPSFFD